MRVVKTDLDGVLLIEPKVFGDARGFFLEQYHRRHYHDAGLDLDIVQINHSRSKKGVLRGLHFQEPSPQGKLIFVINGAIFDVAVDIRRGSPHFGRWVGFELNAQNHRQLWVPPGFAHGFLTLADDTDIVYNCTALYAPQHEHTLLWNDAAIAIQWPSLDITPILSPKDFAGIPLAELRICHPVAEISGCGFY